jgi:hypothetical protein
MFTAVHRQGWQQPHPVGVSALWIVFEFLKMRKVSKMDDDDGYRAMWI